VKAKTMKKNMMSKKYEFCEESEVYLSAMGDYGSTVRIFRRGMADESYGLVAFFNRGVKKLDRFDVIAKQTEFMKNQLTTLLEQVRRMNEDKGGINVVEETAKRGCVHLKNMYNEIGIDISCNMTELDWFIAPPIMVRNKTTGKYIVRAYNDLDFVTAGLEEDHNIITVGEGKSLDSALKNSIETIERYLEYLPVIEQDSFNLYGTGLYEVAITVKKGRAKHEIQQ